MAKAETRECVDGMHVWGADEPLLVFHEAWEPAVTRRPALAAPWDGLMCRCGTRQLALVISSDGEARIGTAPASRADA